MSETQKVLAVIVGLIALITAAVKLDCRWTKAEAFAQFTQQYQSDRMEDTLDRTNDRLYDIEERLKSDPKNPALLREKKQLEDRKKRLEMKLEQYRREEGRQ